MMSLFSSFDLYFFPLSMLIIVMFFFLIFSFVYKFNLLSSMVSHSFKMLESFFLTLKFKSFNKMNLIFFMNLFFFIFLINFSCVISYNFSLTSQMSFALYLGFSIWFSFIMFNLINSFKSFMVHAVPEGTPLYLVWFLFLVELVSNFIRPFTLSIRLVANILAGHLLMILLSKMVFIQFSFFLLYIILNLVEFFVAFIQSYIFSTMITLYYSDVN